MRSAANNVTEGVVPDSGHWIMEEQPKATIALVDAFLEDGKSRHAGSRRMSTRATPTPLNSDRPRP